MKLRKSVVRPKGWLIFVYLLPAICIYTFVVVMPIASSIRLSFYNWFGGVKIIFAGLNNYKMLLSDSIFWDSFKNNVTIAALCIVGQIGLAFIFSSMLNSRIAGFKSFYRVVAYFPATVSAVVVGFAWSFIFNYDYGLINSFLRLLNLGSWASPWLDNPRTIVSVVSIPLIWQYVGFYMVILLSAMTSIDQSVYEMAEIDGATGFQKAVNITLPLIKGTIAVSVMLCIAGNMRIFDHIYVMTNGGPGNSSMVMALDVYKTTFINSQYGYASAMSVAILVLSLALVLISRVAITRPWRKESDL